MKDIDFDELDKAVNSLMGGVKGDGDREKPKTLAISSTLKETEKPQYEKIKQAAEKIGSETLTGPTEKTEVITASVGDEDTILTLASNPDTTTQPASSTPKPSGRFMDVMHPSSDMKNPGNDSTSPVTVPTRPQPVSRQGTTIMPLAAADSPSSAVDEPAVQTVTPNVEQAALVADQQSAGTVEEQPAVPAAPPAEATTDIPAAPIAPVEAPSIEQQPIESPPQTSPFLADAKVEKRPLGAATDSAAELTDSESFDTIDKPFKTDMSGDTQLIASTSEAELPAEFSSDLLAIETNAADTSTEIEQGAEEESSSTDATTQPPVEAISDQPLDSPSDGAIFDTSEYHKPIAHPAKRGHEWLWIVAVLVIVVVCAGGAAAFYLLTVQ